MLQPQITKSYAEHENVLQPQITESNAEDEKGCNHWLLRVMLRIRVYVLQPQITLCWVQYSIAAIDHEELITMLTTKYRGTAIDHVMSFDQDAQRSWDQDAERVWCEGTAPSTTLQEGRGDEMELRGSCGIMCIYCYLNKLFVDLLQLAWILFRELSRSRMNIWWKIEGNAILI